MHHLKNPAAPLARATPPLLLALLLFCQSCGESTDPLETDVDEDAMRSAISYASIDIAGSDSAANKALALSVSAGGGSAVVRIDSDDDWILEHRGQILNGEVDQNAPG